MIDRPTLAAFQFGYGLPHAGPVAPDAMLAGVIGRDAMAARHPTLGFDAAIPMMVRANAARKMVRQNPAQHAAYQS